LTARHFDHPPTAWKMKYDMARGDGDRAMRALAQ